MRDTPRSYALVAPPLAVVSALHWGGRFFLVLYPLLAVLTAATLDEWRAAPRRAPIWQSLAVATAALVGLVAQGVSIDLLSRKLDYSAHLQRVLEARTEPVIATDVWWAPQEMFSRFPTTPIFYVRSQRDLPRLFAHLGPEIDRVLFVSRTGPADAVRVDDRGFAYFSLALWPIPVTPPAAADPFQASMGPCGARTLLTARRGSAHGRVSMLGQLEDAGAPWTRCRPCSPRRARWSTCSSATR